MTAARTPSKHLLRRLRERRLHRIAGTATAILLAVGLYLSYTATTGPPWRSTYDVAVELPTAARLIAQDVVRIRGVRVGQITEVRAVPPGGGRPAHARFEVALDGVDSLPVDTSAQARPASVLGESYLELTPGRSDRQLRAGGTLALDRARASVDFTDIFDIFDDARSRNVQRLIGELAPAVAGRGPELNRLLGSTSKLLPRAIRVADTLVSPGTRLARWFREAERLAAAAAPVGQELAGIARGGAATAAAISDNDRAFDATLARLPRAESAASVALERLAPALDRLAEVATDLRPAARIARAGLVPTNRALRAARPALLRVPRFSADLRRTFSQLTRVTRRAATSGTLRKLAELMRGLDPALTMLLEAQRHCNVIPVMLDGMASTGTAFPLLNAPGNAGHPVPAATLQVSHLGAEGEIFQSSRPSPNVGINYLPNQNAEECESGNELHDAVSQVLTNPPGVQPKNHPETTAAPDVTARARGAGLLQTPEGWRP